MENKQYEIKYFPTFINQFNEMSIFQPIKTGFKFTGSTLMFYNFMLKFVIFFRKLEWNWFVAVFRFDFDIRICEAGNIEKIVTIDCSLNLISRKQVMRLGVGVDDFRHASDNHVITEIFHHFLMQKRR